VDYSKYTHKVTCQRKNTFSECCHRVKGKDTDITEKDPMNKSNWPRNSVLSLSGDEHADISSFFPFSRENNAKIQQSVPNMTAD
jgi:hypothetical protein